MSPRKCKEHTQTSNVEDLVTKTIISYKDKQSYQQFHYVQVAINMHAFTLNSLGVRRKARECTSFLDAAIHSLMLPPTLPLAH